MGKFSFVLTSPICGRIIGNLSKTRQSVAAISDERSIKGLDAEHDVTLRWATCLKRLIYVSAFLCTWSSSSLDSFYDAFFVNVFLLFQTLGAE